MPESFLLALLERAERWAAAAGTSLKHRGSWTPATFAAGRRHEERALLSVAAEVYDLVGATPEGCVLLAELGWNPEAGALPTHEGLQARYANHRAGLAVGAQQKER
ncbi:hypothetical protein [Alicycliphilus denitrificans]|uniref:hypothetical protein n=1 Tax=Alicycliphilus denitrificans TaxID=179636 RepID=UPI0001DA0DE6|nr:hypothetical protein [Alicycliphilus denitrificans]ADV01282.1 putative competence-damaged inducible protein [Alicycliphilus denitrificans BC]